MGKAEEILQKTQDCIIFDVFAEHADLDLGLQLLRRASHGTGAPSRRVFFGRQFSSGLGVSFVVSSVLVDLKRQEGSANSINA